MQLQCEYIAITWLHDVSDFLWINNLLNMHIFNLNLEEKVCSIFCLKPF
jgi:hypothetical protein